MGRQSWDGGEGTAELFAGGADDGGVLECGGKRSATPLLIGGGDGDRGAFESAVVASLCRRTP